MLERSFFDQEPCDLAQALLGKVLRHRFLVEGGSHVWLSAMIIETEAYYLAERGSHSSQGYTEKRRAMFMAPGTIYMYYARGGDSLNFSARGEGNGVLVKSGYPFVDRLSPAASLELMHQLNPINGRRRSQARLCSGQTLVCRSLGLKVPEWNAKTTARKRFFVADTGYRPKAIVQARRLGIPDGRDGHLPYRFVDLDYVASATDNPLKDEVHRLWQRSEGGCTQA